MQYQYNGKEYQKVIAWGGGRSLPRYEYAMEYIDYIVDKRKELTGTQAFGLMIYSPEIIAEEKENVLIVVTTFLYFEEIRENAKAINIKADVEFITDVFPNKAVYFGQYREDAIVEILLRMHTNNKIKYLEIGIPDPINGSNTYHFYLNGHTGVCVEANPDAIKGVRDRRPNDEVMCCGCGAVKDEGSSLKFYVIEGRPSANTFSKDSLNILTAKGFRCEKEIEVPMISLNSIMCQYLPEGADFVSIDVEGYEYTILKDFDFNKYPVSIFCIEKGDETVKSLLIEKGYQQAAETPSNWIFMTAEWVKEHQLLLEK